MTALSHAIAPRRIARLDDRPRDDSPDARRGVRIAYLDSLRDLGALRRLYGRWLAYPEWNRPAPPETLLHEFMRVRNTARMRRGGARRLP